MNFFSVIKLPFILTIIFCNITFAQECFIKNQGQFPAKVIAKKKINGGALFIENSKLTFSFYGIVTQTVEISNSSKVFLVNFRVFLQ